MTTLHERLRDELGDFEYRHEYASDFVDMIVARQIRAIRKERGWTQAILADKLGKKQSFISAIEDEEYGALSLATLKDLARTFDVYLGVRFTSFSRLLEDVEHSSMKELRVPQFSADIDFIASSVPSSVEHGRAGGVTDRKVTISTITETESTRRDSGAASLFLMPSQLAA